jgi:hypothetical protein
MFLFVLSWRLCSTMLGGILYRLANSFLDGTFHGVRYRIL